MWNHVRRNDPIKLINPMDLLIYDISNFFSNQAFAKIQPPFENISISKIPKTYKEISFEYFEFLLSNESHSKDSF